MPLHRRLALLEFAEKAGVWLLEDDYDSEYRYAGRPIPALQGLDGRGRVIYLGSFSKVLFPGLRLGYVAAPRLLTKAMSSARQAQDLHPPVLAQSILAEFIQSGEFGRHLRRLRVLNGKRAQALEAGLRRGLADRLQVPPIEAGLHLTLPLPARVSDWQAAGAAIEHEVQATPLSVYRAVPGGEPGLVLGFGAARVAAIEAGAARLCQALNPLLD
jgi:GntR family transcriptional regulator/MocR family aminotransferase